MSRPSLNIDEIKWKFKYYIDSLIGIYFIAPIVDMEYACQLL